MPTRNTQGTLDLLVDLADYRMLSLSQIAHLHYGGKRAARRRMQQLAEEGLVELLPSAQMQRGGRPENIYGLSQTGLHLLKSEKAVDECLVFDQVCGRNLSHQAAHQLLLGWCRVHLVHLCRMCPRLEFRLLTCNSPLALAPETGVPIARNQVVFDEGKPPEHFTPDAVIAITDTRQLNSILLFLEVDMGSEPIGELREKILRYKQLFRTNGYKRYEEIWGVSLRGFRLLFLTPNNSRIDSVCTVIRAMVPSGFVWATSADRMFTEGISGHIWIPGGSTDPARESILGGLALSAPLPQLAD